MTGLCRWCGEDRELTRHHLLQRRERASLGVSNRTVMLCRLCHNRLHKGTAEERRGAYDEFRTILDRDELAVFEQRSMVHWWERRLAEAG